MFLGQDSVAGRKVLRVRNWERLVSKGRGGSRSNGRITAAMLGSVCGMRTLVRRRLLSLPGGAAAYGVWILLWALAAETCVPGVFLDDDHSPLTAEDLALLTDVRLEELQTALDILSGPEVRLLEMVSLEDVLEARPVSEARHHVEAVLTESDAKLDGEEEGHLRRLKVTATEAVPTECDAKLGGEEEDRLRRLKVTATSNPGSTPAVKSR